jgi:5'-nucleotidase
MQKMAASKLNLSVALGLAALLFTLSAGSQTGKTATVKIIAINDFHGYLQSPGNYRANSEDPDVAAGGADYLAGYIESLATENPNHIVVAAGDLVGASPLVSGLFHDEGTIEAMNRMGLELSSVGNHEFDKGRSELLRKQYGGCSTSDKATCEGAKVGTPIPFEGAKFKYLAANVFDRNTDKTIFPPDAIKTYGGVPVAFIGLTLKGTSTIVTPSGVAGLRFDDEAESIDANVKQLEKRGVRSFVVLIHQGGVQTTPGVVDINACDGGLAGSPIADIVSHLDDAVGLVISGHTHAAYVCEVPNSVGRKIPVTSAASYGRLLTDIDVTLDVATKKITSVSAHNIVIDRTNPKIEPDAKIKAIVDAYALLAAPLADRQVGAITADISNKLNEAGESVLGDVVADAQLAATKESAGAQIALMNRGGIRASLNFTNGGKVTYGELFTVQPFGNSLVTMTLTGAQIKTVLEQQFKGCLLDYSAGEHSGQPDTQILQVSAGFEYTWNPSGVVCNKVDAASITVNGKVVEATEKYRVTVNSFLADGGNQFYEFTRGTDRIVGGQDVDALADFFARRGTVSPGPANRVRLDTSLNP